MKNRRPFSFNILAAEFFSVIQKIPFKERSQFVTQLATDFITLEPVTDYGKQIISETIEKINKQSEYGKLGGKPKHRHPKGTLKAPLREAIGTPKAPPTQKNKDNKKEKDKKEKFAELVTMTQEEHGKLIEKHGSEKTEWMINKLNNAKGAKGYKYESDYRAILNWVVAEADKNFHPVAKMKTIMNPITGMSETVPIESLTWQ